MANEFNRSEDAYTPSKARVEFLELILEPDDAPYPWDTADLDSEAYFIEAEQKFGVEEWLDAEITTRAPTFFAQLDRLWSKITPISAATDVSIQSTLRSEFATRIPQSWLDAIAQKAQQVFLSQQSMADRLVECVQSLLPDWAEDDLLVLARPFAYAMRGSQAADVESVLGEIRHEDWTALSKIEQARVSIAIAHYALEQLQARTN